MEMQTWLKHVVGYSVLGPAVLRGHAFGVFAADWSPDAARIVSASFDRTMRIWDAATGRRLRTIRGHDDAITDCAWAPGAGRRLLSASHDGSVRVWSARSGRCRWVLRGHAGVVHGAAFAPPRGSRVASAGEDRTVRVWDAARGACVSVLAGHAAAATGVGWAPAGDAVVSSSADTHLRVWDPRAQACAQVLRGHSGRVYGGQFSGCGLRVVSASHDGTVRVWDLRGGGGAAAAEMRPGAGAPVRGARFAGSGRVAAAAGRSVVLCDAETGERVGAWEGHAGAVLGVACAPCGAVVSASEDRTLRVWRAAWAEPLHPRFAAEDRRRVRLLVHALRLRSAATDEPLCAAERQPALPQHGVDDDDGFSDADEDTP